MKHSSFPIHNNQLFIGNLTLSILKQRVGQTPFYAYNRDALSIRMQNLRKYMPETLKIHYAIKANPMPALVQHMASLVDGFDVASAGELKTVLDTPIHPKHISLAGPGKQKHEIQQAIAAGITINVESINELDIIKNSAQNLNIPASIALRINPNFELKSAGIKMGGGSKVFGIDEEQIPSLLQYIDTLKHISFKGFHIFIGSQNLNTDAIIETQKKTFLLANKLSKYTQHPLEALNIGGGFGIPYFSKDRSLDVEKIAIQLTDNINHFKKTHPHTEIIIELGRYLVGEAGIYVCKIIDKKISRGKNFIIVDGGLHHHLAATGNFGQIIRKNFPIAIANNVHSEITETVTITGPLCTPLDILAETITLPISHIGDLIVVFQSGAYGYSASPHFFLSQPHCIEVLV